MKAMRKTKTHSLRAALLGTAFLLAGIAAGFFASGGFRSLASLPISGAKALQNQGQLLLSRQQLPEGETPDFVLDDDPMPVYRKCGNQFSAWWVSNGTAVAPEMLFAQTTKFHKSKDREDLFLAIPFGKTLAISGIRLPDGQEVGIPVLPYVVKEVPEPEMEVRVNRKPYQKGEKINKKSSLTFTLVPDKEFAGRCPKDARYRAQNLEILEQGKVGSPQLIKKIPITMKNLMEGYSIELGEYTERMAPNATLYIRISGLTRFNYRNEPVPLENPEFFEGFKLK